MRGAGEPGGAATGAGDAGGDEAGTAPFTEDRVRLSVIFTTPNTSRASTTTAAIAIVTCERCRRVFGAAAVAHPGGATELPSAVGAGISVVATLGTG